MIGSVDARYLGYGWEEMRRNRGLTDAEVSARTLACYAEACAMGFGPRTIFHYRLDNPFMQEHARATVAARARREVARHRYHSSRGNTEDAR
jgi:hypothetical protein